VGQRGIDHRHDLGKAQFVVEGRIPHIGRDTQPLQRQHFDERVESQREDEVSLNEPEGIRDFEVPQVCHLNESLGECASGYHLRNRAHPGSMDLPCVWCACEYECGESCESCRYGISQARGEDVVLARGWCIPILPRCDGQAFHPLNM